MAKLLRLSRPSKAVSNKVRVWWAMRSQKRRRRAGGDQGEEPPAGLGKPVVEAALRYPGSVEVRWSYSGPNVTEFHVYWQQPWESTPTMVCTANPGDVSAMVPYFTMPGTYSFWVSAYDGSQEVWSDVYAATF